MSDNQINYGFRWQRSQLGRADSQPNEEFVASGYQAAPGAVNVDLNVGDVVKRAADGSLTLCVATEAAYGVIDYIYPSWDAVNNVMRFTGSLPGGTAWGTVQDRRSRLGVIPVAGHVFEVDCDDAVTATTEGQYRALIGQNCDISINAVAATRKANPRLDISTQNVTATLIWRIVGIAPRLPGSIDFSGNYVKLLVTANVVQQAPFQPLGI